jgi:hypothetical protein
MISKDNPSRYRRTWPNVYSRATEAWHETAEIGAKRTIFDQAFRATFLPRSPLQPCQWTKVFLVLFFKKEQRIFSKKSGSQGATVKATTFHPFGYGA